MNSKKKSAKRGSKGTDNKSDAEPSSTATPLKSSVDPKLAAKLDEAARIAAEVKTRQREDYLLQQLRNARDGLLSACSDPKRCGSKSIYGSHFDSENSVIDQALNGRADDTGIDDASLRIAKRWADFAACLTDLGEADEWRALDTKRIVSANDYLAAADRQADGTGTTSKSLPPIGGSDLVEIAASVFVPLLNSCTKREQPPSAVADEAIETASGALRAIIKANHSLVDWLGRYFDGADSAMDSQRVAPTAVVLSATPAHAGHQKAESGADNPGPLTKNEDIVLRHLKSLVPDASGHPGAHTSPEIADALSRLRPSIAMGDDELRRVLLSLKVRGLIKNKPRVGYWAVGGTAETHSEGTDQPRG